MSDEKPEGSLAARLREIALSRWENEGGHGLATPANVDHANIPELTNTELVNLRVRVIALENLVISLLAEASDAQREVAREMAGVIAPRPGTAQHPLTTQAATHMRDLVSRAEHFRT